MEENFIRSRVAPILRLPLRPVPLSLMMKTLSRLVRAGHHFLKITSCLRRFNTLTMSAFLRLQMEQSHMVSSGKSVSISKRTAPQWQDPV